MSPPPGHNAVNWLRESVLVLSSKNKGISKQLRVVSDKLRKETLRRKAVEKKISRCKKSFTAKLDRAVARKTVALAVANKFYHEAVSENYEMALLQDDLGEALKDLALTKTELEQVKQLVANLEQEMERIIVEQKQRDETGLPRLDYTAGKMCSMMLSGLQISPRLHRQVFEIVATMIDDRYGESKNNPVPR